MSDSTAACSTDVSFTIEDGKHTAVAPLSSALGPFSSESNPSAAELDPFFQVDSSKGTKRDPNKL